MKSTIRLLSAFWLLSLYSTGQTSDFYYYFEGNKVYLNTDLTSIALTVEGEADESYYEAAFVDHVWQSLDPVGLDNLRQRREPIEPNGVKRRETKTYYTRIHANLPVTMEDYKTKIGTCLRAERIVSAAPCFKGPGDMLVALNCFVNVKIRHESDLPALIEKARLLQMEIIGRKAIRPLWVTLAVTKVSKLNALEASNVLFESGLVESATPDFIVYNAVQTADPLYTSQWHLKNTGQSGGVAGIDMNIEQAWATINGIGSQNIVTAVYDEGIDLSHPDLASNIGPVNQHFDIQTGNNNAIVYGDHGTPCAGIVAGIQNNNIGISGVAPGTKIVPISMNFKAGTTISSSKIIDGFDHCVNNNIDIISCSWSWFYDPLVGTAVSDALTNGRGGKGCIVVFAIGNYAQPQPTYPAGADPRVLVIGGVDRCGYRSGNNSNISVSCEYWTGCCASSYGPYLDLVAGGTGINTTDRIGTLGYAAGDYFGFNGSSAACPAVAGVAALVLSANPNLTAVQVNDLIEKSCKKIRSDHYTYATTANRPNGTWNNELGYGMVDAYGAVLGALNMLCQQNVNILTNVTTVDNQQAALTINASNIVQSGAVAKYHAGDYVKMSTGFSAKAGSDFHAYPVGCTGTYFRQAIGEPSANLQPLTFYSAPSIENKQDLFRVTVFPNPTEGTLNVSITGDLKETTELTLRNYTGLIVERISSEPNNTKLDLQNYPAGIYLLQVSNGDHQTVVKVIKE